MCLSTAYYNKKDDECIAARYVSEINISGDTIVLTDVMGEEMEIKGRLKYVDLTGATVIIDTSEAA